MTTTTRTRLEILLLIIALASMLALPLFILSGCAGTGPDGRWTPADTREAIGTIDRGLDVYQRGQALYNGQAYPVYPTLYHQGNVIPFDP